MRIGIRKGTLGLAVSLIAVVAAFATACTEPEGNRPLGKATNAISISGLGTCPAGIPSVQLDYANFHGELNEALHTSPAGLQGNPGCVYVPPGTRWVQHSNVYLRSGQKILGAGTGSGIGPSLSGVSVIAAYHTTGYFISNNVGDGGLKSSDDFMLHERTDSGVDSCQTELRSHDAVDPNAHWYQSNGLVKADNVELGKFRLETADLDPTTLKLSNVLSTYRASTNACTDATCPSDLRNPYIWNRAIAFVGWHESNSKSGQRYYVSGLDIHDLDIRAVSGITLGRTVNALVQHNQVRGVYDTSTAGLAYWAGRAPAGTQARGQGKFTLDAGITLTTENLGAQILGNTVDGVTAEGISIDLGQPNTCVAQHMTTGTLVEDNTVKDVGSYGLLVFGGHLNTFRNNTLTNAFMWPEPGYGQQIAIHGGSFNRFELNKVKGCGQLAHINNWIDEDFPIPASGNALVNNTFTFDPIACGAKLNDMINIDGLGALRTTDNSQTMIDGNTFKVGLKADGTSMTVPWPAVLITDGFGTSVRNNTVMGFTGHTWAAGITPPATLPMPTIAQVQFVPSTAYNTLTSGAHNVSVTGNLCCTQNTDGNPDACDVPLTACPTYTCGDDCSATSDTTNLRFDGVCDGTETSTSCPADCGYTGSFFDATRATGRTVAGDFDGDGIDEMAAIVDNGNACVQLVVFDRAGHRRVWTDLGCGNFAPVLTTGRVVAGDFNGDGKDDIIAFYDMGSCRTMVHTFQSTGSAFWWYTGWFDSGVGNLCASSITDRVVAADFTGDGKDDVAFLSGSGLSAHMHMLVSTGNGFVWNGAGSSWDPSLGTFEAFRCNGRFLAGDFSGDGQKDIICLYDYGSATGFLVWRHKENDPGFYFEPWKYIYTSDGLYSSSMQYTTVAGDFDHDGDDDIASFYDYQNRCVTLLHMFLSLGNNFNWIGAGTFNGSWVDNHETPQKVCDGQVRQMASGTWSYGWWDGPWWPWILTHYLDQLNAPPPNGSGPPLCGDAPLIDRGWYCPAGIRGRIVAGNFGGPTYVSANDPSHTPKPIADFAVLYDWGNGISSFDRFLSDGNRFSLSAEYTTSFTSTNATTCNPGP